MLCQVLLEILPHHAVNYMILKSQELKVTESSSFRRVMSLLKNLGFIALRTLYWSEKTLCCRSVLKWSCELSRLPLFMSGPRFSLYSSLRLFLWFATQLPCLLSVSLPAPSLQIFWIFARPSWSLLSVRCWVGPTHVPAFPQSLCCMGLSFLLHQSVKSLLAWHFFSEAFPDYLGQSLLLCVHSSTYMNVYICYIHIYVYIYIIALSKS